MQKRMKDGAPTFSPGQIYGWGGELGTRPWYDGYVQSSSDMVALSAELRSQRGVDLLAAGDAAGAATAFREAIAADPEHIEAHHGMIRALCDAEQFEAAVAAALALTTLTPNDPLAHTSLSIALQKAGHVPEAEAAAGRARILEWKQQLMQPADASGAAAKEDSFA
jgi:Flp pilus assembly protein TadD